MNFESGKLDHDHSTHVRTSIGLWKGDAEELKRCWTKPSLGKEFSKEFNAYKLLRGLYNSLHIITHA